MYKVIAWFGMWEEEVDEVFDTLYEAVEYIEHEIDNGSLLDYVIIETTA